MRLRLRAIFSALSTFCTSIEPAEANQDGKQEGDELTLESSLNALSAIVNKVDVNLVDLICPAIPASFNLRSYLKSSSAAIKEMLCCPQDANIEGADCSRHTENIVMPLDDADKCVDDDASLSKDPDWEDYTCASSTYFCYYDHASTYCPHTCGVCVKYREIVLGNKKCASFECNAGTVCNDKGKIQDAAGGSTADHICVKNAAKMKDGDEYNETKNLCFATDGVAMCSENTLCDERKEKTASCVPVDAVECKDFDQHLASFMGLEKETCQSSTLLCKNNGDTKNDHVRRHCPYACGLCDTEGTTLKVTLKSNSTHDPIFWVRTAHMTTGLKNVTATPLPLSATQGGQLYNVSVKDLTLDIKAHADIWIDYYLVTAYSEVNESLHATTRIAELMFNLVVPNDNFINAKDVGQFQIVPGSVTLNSLTEFNTTTLSRMEREKWSLIHSGFHEQVIDALSLFKEEEGGESSSTQFEQAANLLLKNPTPPGTGFRLPRHVSNASLPSTPEASFAQKLECESSSSSSSSSSECVPRFLTNGARCINPAKNLADCLVFDRPFPTINSAYYNLSSVDDSMRRMQTIFREVVPSALSFIASTSEESTSAGSSANTGTDDITLTARQIFAISDALNDARSQQSGSGSMKSSAGPLEKFASEVFQTLRIKGLREALKRTTLWDGRTAQARRQFIDLSGITLEVSLSIPESWLWFLPTWAKGIVKFGVEVTTWKLNMTTFVYADSTAVDLALNHVKRTPGIEAECVLRAIDTIALSLQDGTISIGRILLEAEAESPQQNVIHSLKTVLETRLFKYLISQLAMIYIHRQFAPLTAKDTASTLAPINTKLKNMLNKWKGPNACPDIETKHVKEHDVTRLMMEALPLLPLVNSYIHQTVKPSWTFNINEMNGSGDVLRIKNVANADQLHFSHNAKQQMQVRMGTNFRFAVEKPDAWKMTLSFLGDVSVSSSMKVTIRGDANDEKKLYNRINCLAAHLQPSVRVVDPRVLSAAGVKLTYEINGHSHDLILETPVVRAALELALDASLHYGPFEDLFQQPSEQCSVIASRAESSGKWTPSLSLKSSINAAEGILQSIKGANSMLQILRVPPFLAGRQLSFGDAQFLSKEIRVHDDITWHATCKRLNVRVPERPTGDNDASGTPYLEYKQDSNVVEFFADAASIGELDVDVCLSERQGAKECLFTLGVKIEIGQAQLHALFSPELYPRDILFAALDLDIVALCLRDISSSAAGTCASQSFSDSIKKMIRMTLATLVQQITRSSTAVTAGTAGEKTIVMDEANTRTISARTEAPAVSIPLSHANDGFTFSSISRVITQFMNLLTYDDYAKFLPKGSTSLIAWDNWSISSHQQKGRLGVTHGRAHFNLTFDSFSLTVDMQLLFLSPPAWYRLGIDSESFNAASRFSISMKSKTSEGDVFYPTLSCLMRHVKMVLEDVQLKNVPRLKITVQPLGDKESEKSQVWATTMTDNLENERKMFVNSVLRLFVSSQEPITFFNQATEACISAKSKSAHLPETSAAYRPPARTIPFKYMKVVHAFGSFLSEALIINVLNAAADQVLQKFLHSNYEGVWGNITVPVIRRIKTIKIRGISTSEFFQDPTYKLMDDERLYVAFKTSVTQQTPLTISLEMPPSTSGSTFTIEIGLVRLELHARLELALPADIEQKPDAWWTLMCWMPALSVDAFVPLVRLSPTACLINKENCNFSQKELQFFSDAISTFANDAIRKTRREMVKSKEAECKNLRDDEDASRSGVEERAIPQLSSWTKNQIRWTQFPKASTAKSLVSQVAPAEINDALKYPHRHSRVLILDTSKVNQTFLNIPNPFSSWFPLMRDPIAGRQLVAGSRTGDADNMTLSFRSDHRVIFESPSANTYQLRGATVINVTRVADFDPLLKVLDVTTWEILSFAKAGPALQTRFPALHSLRNVSGTIVLVQIRDRNTNRWYSRTNHSNLRAVFRNITGNYVADALEHNVTFTFAHAWDAHFTASFRESPLVSITLDMITFKNVLVSDFRGPLWNMPEDIVLQKGPSASVTYAYARDVLPRQPRKIFLQNADLQDRCVDLHTVSNAYVLSGMPVETMDGIYVPVSRTNNGTSTIADSFYSNGKFTLRRSANSTDWVLCDTHSPEDRSLHPSRELTLPSTDARIQRASSSDPSHITFGHEKVPLPANDRRLTLCFMKTTQDQTVVSITGPTVPNGRNITYTCPTAEDDHCFYLQITSQHTLLAMHDTGEPNGSTHVLPLKFDVINADDAAIGAKVVLSELTVGIHGRYKNRRLPNSASVPLELEFSGREVELEAAAILELFPGRFDLNYEQRMHEACKAKFTGNQTKMLTLVFGMLLQNLTHRVGEQHRTTDFEPVLYLEQVGKKKECNSQCEGPYHKHDETGKMILSQEQSVKCILDVDAKRLYIDNVPEDLSHGKCEYNIITKNFEQDLIRRVSRLLVTRDLMPRLDTWLAPANVDHDTCPGRGFDLNSVESYAHFFAILFAIFFFIASVCALIGLIGGLWCRWWDPQTTHILPNWGAMGSDLAVPAGVGVAIMLYIVAALCGLIASSFALGGILKGTFRVTHPIYGVQRLMTEEVYEFALWGSIVEMYQSGAILLFVFICLGSGVLPYIKCVAMLYVWVAPARACSERWRMRLVHFAHYVGKIALMDILFLNFFVHIFRVHLEFPVRSRDGTTVLGSLDMYCQPQFGFYCFFGSAILCIACSFTILTFARRSKHTLHQREWQTVSLTSDAQFVAFTTMVQLGASSDDTKERIGANCHKLVPVPPSAMEKRFALNEHHAIVSQQLCASMGEKKLPVTRPTHSRDISSIADCKKKRSPHSLLSTKVCAVKNLARYHAQAMSSSSWGRRMHMLQRRYVAWEHYSLPALLVPSLIVLLFAFLLKSLSVTYGGMIGYLMAFEAESMHQQSGYTAQVNSPNGAFQTTSRFYSMNEIGAKGAKATVFDYETEDVDTRVYVIEVMFFIMTIASPVLLLALGMLLWYKPVRVAEWFRWWTATAFVQAQNMFNILLLTVLLEIFSVDLLTKFMVGNNCDAILPFLDQMFGDKFEAECMTTRPNYTGWMSLFVLHGILGIFCISRVSALIHAMSDLVSATVKEPAVQSNDSYGEKGVAVDNWSDGTKSRPPSNDLAQSTYQSRTDSFESDEVREAGDGLAPQMVQTLNEASRLGQETPEERHEDLEAREPCEPFVNQV